ncbi:MAG: DNA polymerase III subunit gamma/tau [candidate division Zixibacteria bacterium]
MGYLVLARKYRPSTFEEVVAQEHVTRTLRNAISSNKIGSGYLFCGPRGTGKTTIARLLAKAINCKDGPTVKPCSDCPACKEIAAGRSLDVLEIDAASNTGVDDIRQLRENVRYLPTHGHRRIYIIDEVHRLSGSAFDALLKTLEEPPEHVVFIFATTEPIKVPDTIHSRTQRFDFRRVSVAELSAHLKTISEKEKIDSDQEALKLISRKADGSVRDSLSLLDQVAAFAGDKITEADVVNALGLVDREFLIKYTTAIAESDRKKVLEHSRQLFESGLDVSDFVSELLEHFRLLMILQSDPDSSDRLSLSTEELSVLLEQNQSFTLGDLLRFIKILTDLNNDLRSDLDERLLLEVAGIKMAELESTVSLEDILSRLNSGAFGSAQPNSGGDLFGAAQKKSPEVNLASTPEESPAGRPLTIVKRSPNLAQVKAGWDQFLGRLRTDEQMLASQLAMAAIRSVRDDSVLLLFDSAQDGAAQLVKRPDNRKLIENALSEHFGTSLSIEFEMTEPPPNSSKDKKTMNRADAKKLIADSPRIQSLIEKVDGEVIGIRKNEE